MHRRLDLRVLTDNAAEVPRRGCRDGVVPRPRRDLSAGAARNRPPLAKRSRAVLPLFQLAVDRRKLPADRRARRL
jgi:hypothetical protein